MRTALFALSNFFVLAAAAMISDMIFVKRGRWFRFLSLLCFAAVEVAWIELAMGLARKLTFRGVSFVAMCVFFLTGITWLIVHRQQLSQRIYSGWLSLVPVIFIIALILGGLAGRYGFQGTHFCEDDLSYHAPMVAQWYQQSDISMLKCFYAGYEYNGYKWFNTELLSLWFLLPFGQDGFVFLAGLFWMVLTCAAVIVLMQTMSIDRKWYGLMIFVVFCTDVILNQATWTFTAVDLAGPAMLMAALAFLFSAAKSCDEKPLSCILLAGLCGGFACGSKVPFVLPCLILMAWIFFAFAGKAKMRLSYVLFFGFCAMLTGGFWYIRNLVLTGNPVFPAQAGPFDGPLTREVLFGTSIAGYVIKSDFDISIILEILQQHFAWPVGIMVLSAVGYITGLVLLFRDSRNRRIIGLLLLIAAVMLVAYVVMPFSAQYGYEGNLAISLRFIIGPFLVGLILFSLGLNTHGRLRWLMYGIYFLGVGLAFWATPNAVKMLAGASAFVWLLCFYFYRKPLPSILFSPLVVFSMIMGGLLGLAIMFSVQQAKTDRRLFTDRLTGLNLGGCWQRLDMLPTGSKVTVLGALAYYYYPCFGRHYQLCPWPLIPGLKSYQPPHLRWIDDPVYTTMRSKPLEMDSKMWIGRLMESQTEYIVIQRYPGRLWPGVYDVLQKSDIAEQIDGGNNWTIWKTKQ